MVVKKLQNRDTQERLQEYIDDAATLGYKFIEVMDVKRLTFGRAFIGVEELTIAEKRVPGQQAVSGLVPNIIKDGVLDFHPDGKGRCYGYVLDTQKNREFLASQLERPLCTVLDTTTLNEIKMLAIKMGYMDEARKIQDPTLVLNTAQIELDDAKAELAKLRAEKEELEKAKPLKSTADARAATKRAVSRRENQKKKKNEDK